MISQTDEEAIPEAIFELRAVFSSVICSLTSLIVTSSEIPTSGVSTIRPRNRQKTCMNRTRAVIHIIYGSPPWFLRGKSGHRGDPENAVLPRAS